MRGRACALGPLPLEVDVPRRILAHPQDGVPGTIEEAGQRVHGVYYLAAYLYGPEETMPAGMDTLSKLRALHGSPTQRSLVVPFTGEAKFTVGSDSLGVPDDRVIVLIEFSYPDSGPPPEVCSCGKLSFRHAVSYHEPGELHRTPSSMSVGERDRSGGGQ